jgi:hypothetical protein
MALRYCHIYLVSPAAHCATIGECRRSGIPALDFSRLGRMRYIGVIFPVLKFLPKRFLLLISLSEPPSGTLMENNYVDEVMCCM